MELTTSSAFGETAVWFQGRTYPPTAKGRLSDELAAELSRLIWFSYRRNFPRIPGTSLSSDAGWGCMLRTAQMMFARALVQHFSNVSRANPEEIRREVIRLFEDHTGAPFSIHHMAVRGSEICDKPAGSWLGPAAVSFILRDLVDSNGNAHTKGLRVCVSTDGAVYRDQVKRLFETAQAVLLLIPLRLGLESLNRKYIPQLTAAFKNRYIAETANLTKLDCTDDLVLKRSDCAVDDNFHLGVIGGRPNASLYFVAAQEDEYLIYLDPHTVQESVAVSSNASTSSYFRTSFDRLRVADLDPSMAVGYLFSSMNQFNQFADSNQKQRVLAQIFAILDSAPIASSSSSSVGSMMRRNANNQPLSDDGDTHDDIVFL